jgi:hypothetical protein
VIQYLDQLLQLVHQGARLKKVNAVITIEDTDYKIDRPNATDDIINKSSGCI